MTIKGTIKHPGFNAKSFEGKNGTQNTKDFLVSYQNGNFPKDVVLTAWNDLIPTMDNTYGDKEFSIEVTSREYKGKYYTTAKVWKVA